MKKAFALLPVVLAASVILTATSARSWCWKRDTGAQLCGVQLYTEKCCDGKIEFWPGSTLTYRISESSDPARLLDVYEGLKRWNDLEMSTFRFVQDVAKPTDPAWAADHDGVNLINIDSRFCDHYGEYCAMGVLGFSATYTSTLGSVYQATEADIILNGAEYEWGSQGSLSPIIDTVAVVAHEGGHNAGLSHPGGACRNGGSQGCGNESPASTMYWNYSAGQPTDKSTLELDDVAAMVYGYPVGKLQVKVIDKVTSAPIKDATVTVIGTAFPASRNAAAEVTAGGYVYGDVPGTLALFGDKVFSPTYDTSASHFALTDDNGFTDQVIPLTRQFWVKVVKGNAVTTEKIEMQPGDYQPVIKLDAATPEDANGPKLLIASHQDDQVVKTATITLSGTATDEGRGGNGVSTVEINGARVAVEVASGDGTLSWSSTVNIVEGQNRITVAAHDNSARAAENVTEHSILIRRDSTGPQVVSFTPASAIVDPKLSPVIAIKFDEKLDGATVTAANVRFDKGITGTPVYDADTGVITMAPAQELEPSTSYTVTVDDEVTDLAGNKLQKVYTHNLSTTAPAPDPGQPPTSETNTGNKGGGAPTTSGTGCFIEALVR